MKRSLDPALVGDVRMTSEYAAAFDLEVWKAQQQARFRSQLRQAKEKMEQQVLLAVKKKERENIAELEDTRKELEKVAKNLQDAEQDLQRRTQQLELQAAAFEARRVKVAEQHELHVNRVEQSAKRTVEEALARQESLKAQVLEKDTIITQLREKLQYIETEFDSLKGNMDCYLADQENAHAKAVREMEQKLTQAVKTIDKLKNTLGDRTQLLQKVWRENEELQVQLDHYKFNSEGLLKKYNELLNMWYTREHRQKEEELKRLEYEVQQRQQQEIPRKEATRDPLYTMLHSLKADVALHLNETFPTLRGEEGSRSHKSYSLPYVCVERPLPSTAAPSSTPTVVEVAAAPPVVSPPPATNVTPFGEKADEEEVAASKGNTPNTSTSSSSSSFPRVEVVSWHSEDNDAAAAPLADISPSPEDFAQAAQTGAASAESARSEMEIFVRQLKMNRQKLLDTGVYNEDQAVIKEMDEKISLYKQYLSAYH